MKLRIVVELTDLEAKALAAAFAYLQWPYMPKLDSAAVVRVRKKLEVARRQAEYELEDWATK